MVPCVCWDSAVQPPKNGQAVLITSKDAKKQLTHETWQSIHGDGFKTVNGADRLESLWTLELGKAPVKATKEDKKSVNVKHLRA